jgi:hypothetical protein
MERIGIYDIVCGECASNPDFCARRFLLLPFDFTQLNPEGFDPFRLTLGFYIEYLKQTLMEFILGDHISIFWFLLSVYSNHLKYKDLKSCRTDASLHPTKAWQP